MWIFRWTFIAIIIIIVLGISLQNSEQVTVRLFHWGPWDVPMFLVIYVAFCFGV